LERGGVVEKGVLEETKREKIEGGYRLMVVIAWNINNINYKLKIKNSIIDTLTNTFDNSAKNNHKNMSLSITN